MKDKHVLFLLYLYERELEHAYGGDVVDAAECEAIRQLYMEHFNLNPEVDG